MKIGLVRHFRVKQEYPAKRWVASDEVMRWFNEYEKAEIEDGQTDLLGIDWQSCYTSDLPRAAHTAAAIFHGRIVPTAKLREIPNPVLTSKLRMPFILWAIYIRLSWMLNRNTRMQIKAIEAELGLFLDEVVHRQEHVLLVTHGGVMMLLHKELGKRGFRGPSIRNPQNGKLYVFENRAVS